MRYKMEKAVNLLTVFYVVQSQLFLKARKG